MLLINTFGQDSLSGLLFNFKTSKLTETFPSHNYVCVVLTYCCDRNSTIFEIVRFLKLYRTDIVHMFYYFFFLSRLGDSFLNTKMEKIIVFARMESNNVFF